MGSRMNPDRKIYIGGLPNDANKYSSLSPPFSLKCFVGRFGFVQLGPFIKIFPQLISIIRTDKNSIS